MSFLRQCPKCKNTYDDPEDFPVDKSRKTGRYPYCKPCAVALQQLWRMQNPEKHQVIVDRYRAGQKARHSG